MSDLFYNKNGFDHEIVLGIDERRGIIDTTKPPFRWICSLEVEFPEPVINSLGVLENPGKNWESLPKGDKGCGSGLLISPNRVLTASHVIMGLKIVPGKTPDEKILKPVLANRVHIIPGRDGKNNKSAFGKWKAVHIKINSTFCKKLIGNIEHINRNKILDALSHDFAILELVPKLNKNNQSFHLGNKIGWWGKNEGYQIYPITSVFRKVLKDCQVKIGGYPGEKGKYPCSVLHLSTDVLVSSSPQLNGKQKDLLLYLADTSAGMSGSPVWIENHKGNKCLIGIHTSFSTFKKVRSNHILKGNLGVLITDSIMVQLKNWGIRQHH